MGGSLTQEQVDRFDADGYLVVENLLSPEDDIDPIVAEYAGVLETLASDLDERGVIRSKYSELPFGPRAIQVFQDSGSVHQQYFDFSLPANVLPDTPLWVGPAVFQALRNERILDAVESLIGGEIYSNPIQHVRIKPPEALTPTDAEGRIQLGATPWHQDNGVQTEEADQTEMITVWFPLFDTDAENGCLHVVPRSHFAGLLRHCPGRGGAHIPDQFFDVGRSIPLPLRRGGVILLNRHTCHGSLPNLSDHIRWSFDLRYNPVGQPTGRGVLPGFVARSRRHPETELRDWRTWSDLWHETRDRLAAVCATGDPSAAPRFYRWDGNHPACA